ncbi:hypothetical protein SAMN05421828_10535 [Acidiphilium rubrum]|uniref:Uncharacterized protein n=1 Tax=Acidiphilium rubrum TaxID=526 RepID=A0A8G2CKE4_ACIRU|nr:hypothetical protein SAMN05421828_10535 [Acidiphilium rubrum]
MTTPIKRRRWRETKADVRKLIRNATDHATARAAEPDGALSEAFARALLAVEITAMGHERTARETARELIRRGVPCHHPGGSDGALADDLATIWEAATASVLAMYGDAAMVTAETLANIELYLAPEQGQAIN